MSFEEKNKVSRHDKRNSDSRKHSHDAKKGQKNISEIEAEESAKQTLVSMAFSLILVGLAILFVMFFHNFLKGRTYNKPTNPVTDIENVQEGEQEDLILDETFERSAIIIKDIKEKDFCATEKPGMLEEGSRRLRNGEVLEVIKKGSRDGKDYYVLKDHTYVEDDETHVQKVKEYIPLEGYIVITYISTAGVRLRTWIDYEADNVVKSAYVGDKIDIRAMITLENGNSAFQTEDGLFITTDSRYFTDSTNLKDMLQPTTEAGSKKEETSSAKTEDKAEEAASEDKNPQE